MGLGTVAMASRAALLMHFIKKRGETGQESLFFIH